MAIRNGFVLFALVISAMASACYAEEKARYFSDLRNTMEVTDSTRGQVLEAGDTITARWGLKAGEQDSAYKTIKVKLCFAPMSQVNRPERKTDDNLAKDKTCPYDMFNQPYFSAKNITDTFVIGNDIPGAAYFIRVYVYDSDGKEVAYGQTTNAAKHTNLFEVKGVTGRSMAIDVASGVYSFLVVFIHLL